MLCNEMVVLCNAMAVLCNGRGGVMQCDGGVMQCGGGVMQWPWWCYAMAVAVLCNVMAVLCNGYYVMQWRRCYVMASKYINLILVLFESNYIITIVP